jgi:hypothetical protein
MDSVMASNWSEVWGYAPSTLNPAMLPTQTELHAQLKRMLLQSIMQPDN